MSAGSLESITAIPPQLMSTMVTSDCARSGATCGAMMHTSGRVSGVVMRKYSRRCRRSSVAGIAMLKTPRPSRRAWLRDAATNWILMRSCTATKVMFLACSARPLAAGFAPQSMNTVFCSGLTATMKVRMKSSSAPKYAVTMRLDRRSEFRIAAISGREWIRYRLWSAPAASGFSGSSV